MYNVGNALIDIRGRPASFETCLELVTPMQAFCTVGATGLDWVRRGGGGAPRLQGGLVKHLANSISADTQLAMAA